MTKEQIIFEMGRIRTTIHNNQAELIRLMDFNYSCENLLSRLEVELKNLPNAETPEIKLEEIPMEQTEG